MLVDGCVLKPFVVALLPKCENVEVVSAGLPNIEFVELLLPNTDPFAFGGLPNGDEEAV